jgi:hypothetical protein
MLFKSTILDSCKSKQTGPIMLECSNARMLANAANWLVLLLFCLLGCVRSSNSGNATAPNNVVNVDSRTHQVDAGVVFWNRASYLCVPLSRFQITGDQNPIAVSTSCKCLTATIVSYQHDSTETARAVLLEFEPSIGTAIPENPSSLAVTVKVALSSGEARELSVNFLHTRLADH